MALQCGDLGGRKTFGMLIYVLKMGGFSMAMLNSQMVYGLWNIYNSIPMDPAVPS
jgi:hypothetical protein